MARRVVVRGRVQGVGFRFFAERAARELGVRGWVRNLPDGCVESVAEGDEGAVTAYIARLEQGPWGARVEGVEVDAFSPQGFSSFEVTR
jgi:acylphosphatase